MIYKFFVAKQGIDLVVYMYVYKTFTVTFIFEISAFDEFALLGIKVTISLQKKSEKRKIRFHRKKIEIAKEVLAGKKLFCQTNRILDKTFQD